MAQMLDDIIARLNNLPEADRKAVIADAMTATKGMLFVPNVGPQTLAYFSEADETFYGGCVSGDTEYLSPEGWRRIDQYDGGKIAQWSPSGDLEFVFPDGYTEAACDELIHFKNARVSMLLSNEHRVPLYDWSGRFTVKSAGDIAKKPSRHKIPVHFSPATDGLDMSDDLIRLGVAIHADGNLTHRKKDGGAHCRISLRKDRKKDRLVSLLTNLRIPWHEYRNPNRPTEVRYGFDSPILTKSYTGEWWQANQAQLSIILDEMSYWDGDISGANGGDITFNSTRKIDADFIQYAAHACGRVATIADRRQANESHSVVYRVSISRNGSVKSSVVLRGDAIEINRVPAERMYCFTTASSFWLARHNGFVFATGNSPGCGKSALLCGLALTEHKRTLLLRREYPQVKGLIDEVKRMVGNKDGYNGQDKIWRNLPGDREIEFGSCQHEDDKENYQGRAHDLKGFDEITHFTESQYRYIIGWNRSTNPGQRCRVLCTGNPPTSATGLWVIKYWGPWLDKNHPNPAKPGELRWFTTIDGKDTEVDGRGPYQIDGREVYARSRTYVPGKLEDNPDLAETGYASVIEAMPEPMRTMMREARFDLSVSDDPWQVIPSAWVHAAQERWTQYAPQGIPMCAIAADVAQGGKDNNVISARYDGWFAPLEIVPGVLTPLGKDIAGILVARRRDGAKVIIDCGGGYGGSAYKTLNDNNIDVCAYKGSEGTDARTADRLLSFKNVRTAAYWKFREALDPDQPGGSHICLPPSTKLVSHLTAPTYEVVGTKIVMESKEDVTDKLGESPDEGDAVVMCWWQGARMSNLNGGWSGQRLARAPKVVLGRDSMRRRH